ncbi:P-loop containing nucleoside triphosphate hydrolase protein [Leptodontidium sp. 2 PMI_412]|nr:P-loop containing nucleoside triphosphate hydrolase protein [Leptodontidium sp. 2 PMI_412]
MNRHDFASKKMLQAFTRRRILPEHIIGLTEANFRPQPAVHGIPFHRNFRFRSSDGVLDDLRKNLRPRSGSVLSGQTSCVIHGIGGVGKTQLALEHKYRYREDYSYLFWVRADSGMEISISFASFARSLMPGSTLQDQLANVQLVRDWMVQYDRWLLVFDNADSPDLDLSQFWPPSSHGSVIVTIQRRDFSHWAANGIHLETFNEDDGAHLILNVVDQSTETHSTETIKIAQDISNELGGLPLLLSHIAGYIDDTKAPLASILENLRQPSAFNRMWAFESTTSTNFQYGEPMAKVWRLALDSLDPQALRTLQIMSMLSPNEVYEDMLFGEWEDPELDFLTDSRRFDFNELRRSLVNRHLVEAGEESGRTKLSMHRVLKRHILQKSTRKEARNLASSSNEPWP